MTKLITHIKKTLEDPRYLFTKSSDIIGNFIKHNNYKKFIVLTRSRTGSNLLISMLDSHKAISAKGEIFQKLNGKKVVDILDHVFCKYSLNIKAVGFKIFYYHPMDDHSGLIWEEFKKIEDLHFIHLKRRNILKTLLSRKIAGKTDLWKKGDERRDRLQSQNKKITFSKEELLEGFLQTRTWENDYSTMFSGKRMVNIDYEDLVANPEQVFRKITTFLNLENIKPKSSLKKQNPEKLIDLVENYVSLKKDFINTEWLSFFDD